jgi:ribose/xylose/arabinose/galactoside ABC-type transport system permease subunit
MDIILGAFISVLTQGFKILSKKFGKEASRNIVLIVVFGLVMTFTVLTRTGMLSMETVQSFFSMLTAAIATYELITKPLLKALNGESQ